MTTSFNQKTTLKPDALTKYPIGSLLEFWSVSWPLMLGFLSSHAMIFIDRLYLARYSIDSLNAVANSSLAYYSVTVIPMAICAVSEVLVGHLRGANKFSNIGVVTWQMVWLSLMFSPLFFLIGKYLSPYFFLNTGNEANEILYFSTLLTFAPFACCNMALNAFFIGLGKIKFVAISTLIGNLSNMVLGYFFILGCQGFLGLGVKGAGVAMGISQIIQCVALFTFFFTKKNIVKYGVARVRWNCASFSESFKLGLPAGAAHFMEVSAHYLFFRILIKSGADCLTIVVVVQSFSMFVAFLIEAQSKGVTAIISNLIGSKSISYVPKVIKTAFSFHALLFLALLSLFTLAPGLILGILISKSQPEFLINLYFRQSFIAAFFWMLLFFLLDGFSWIIIGFLTSIKETVFIFVCSTFIHWFFYLPLAYLLLIKMNRGSGIAWMTIALCSFIHFTVFFLRYRQKYAEKKLEYVSSKEL